MTIPDMINKIKEVLIQYYKIIQSFISCLLARFSKNVFLDPKCKICQSTKYNCGIIAIIILLLIALIF